MKIPEFPKNQGPSRGWSGLTEEELKYLWLVGIKSISRERFVKIARQVEAYLKEKNA